MAVRDGVESDAEAIEAVRRASWRAAYAGLIAQRYIDRATATATDAATGVTRPDPWRRTLVAVADGSSAIVGYACFGPERVVPTMQRRPAGQPASTAPETAGPAVAGPKVSVPAVPAPKSPPPWGADRLTPAGAAGEAGELYALYVDPGWWSTGTGRALMAAAVERLTASAYQRAVLWVLDGNARARAFYEKAAWQPDGALNVLMGLGGVREVRYARALLRKLARRGLAAGLAGAARPMGHGAGRGLADGGQPRAASSRARAAARAAAAGEEPAGGAAGRSIRADRLAPS
jgi:GNAT superfamily N-acetyltransferase